MNEKHELVSKVPDNSKVGFTVSFNQKEEPFEVTVYFKKAGKSAEELREENAVTLTASCKLRLDIGKHNSVEIFAEKSAKLIDFGTEEAGGSLIRRDE